MKQTREAVIFDMDGVISDTERYYVNAIVERLNREGLDVKPEDMGDLFGSTQERIWKILKQRYGLEGREEDYIRDVHRIREGYVKEYGVHPMPGCVDLIRRLHRSGIRLAVASSSPRSVIEYNVRTFGVLECFQALVSGQDCKAGKPDPEIYLLAAKRMDTDPGECAVIEDSSNGVQAAKAAGMYCFAYVPPQAWKQDVSMADEQIEDFRWIEAERFLRNRTQEADQRN